ncbi:MAG: rRNA maturation RNase YbeY [bacterium]
MSCIEVFILHPEGVSDQAALVELTNRVLRQEGWRFKVRLIIVADAELRRLNRLFLGVDENTDVIAFPPEDGDDPWGEVYISLDQARQQATEADEPLHQVLNRLLVHGLLHLGGWCDDTEQARAEMLNYGEQYVL